MKGQDEASIRVKELNIDTVLSPAYRQIWDNSLLGVMVLDKEGIVRYINRLLIRTDDLQDADILGKKMVDFYPMEKERHVSMRTIKSGKMLGLGIEQVFLIPPFYVVIALFGLLAWRTAGKTMAAFTVTTSAGPTCFWWGGLFCFIMAMSKHGDIPALVAESMTPGGLNALAMARINEQGGFRNLTEALDAVKKSIVKQSIVKQSIA